MARHLLERLPPPRVRVPHPALLDLPYERRPRPCREQPEVSGFFHVFRDVLCAHMSTVLRRRRIGEPLAGT
ncbi:hypothetical protein GCM10010431_69600 [Streptomyces kunmingensis]